jgi:hypothetical protein
VKRLVVWGGRENLDSIRHILRHYHTNAHKLGIPTVWLPDLDNSMMLLADGDTVLAVDVTSKHLGYRANVDYCLHNFDGGSELCRTLEQTPERLLRLQVYTDAATGDVWDACRRFDPAARTLFQPWGTDLLAEEFLEPVFVPESREVVFVGAVWSEQYEGAELGNEATIAELKRVCEANRLVFVHRTHVPDEENVRLVRASRLAPALAGAWQVEHGYVPCRALKNVSYGQLCITNVPSVRRIMGAAGVDGQTVQELVEEALRLKRTVYTNLVREQQRQVQRFTYRESLASIERAFAEIQA